METFDVAVIGAGPSGTSSAYFLAERGFKVVLVDKETLPRYKTCGGGFVYRGRNALPFDIKETVEREFKAVTVYFNDLHLRFQEERQYPIISMVMRDNFDHFLTKKALEKNVVLKQGWNLDKIEKSDSYILYSGEERLRAAYIIAADGVLSPTAKMAGWKETRTLIPALECELTVSEDAMKKWDREVRFDFGGVPYGYGWVFPKRNHLSVGVAVLRKHKAGLKNCYQEYLDFLGITPLTSKQYGYQIPVSPRTDGFAKDNMLLTGDAAGFADPITAEGISNAIYSGILAAESILEVKNTSKEVASVYESKLREKLLPELQKGVALSAIFYEHTYLRKWVLKFYGNKFCKGMTDIYSGFRSYPNHLPVNTVLRILSIFKKT